MAEAISIEDLRRLARRRLPRAIFDFFDGGAEDERTLRDNVAAFGRVRLLPRVLVDVSAADAGTTFFGQPSAMPLAIAPTGGIGVGRPGADLMLARAARAMGVPFTLSTPATASIEEVAEKAGGRLWFQLYVVRDREFREKLVRRAAEAGYEALLVTVDLPVTGKRERDPRNGLVMPFRPNWRNGRDLLLRPAWIWNVWREGLPEMANFAGYRFASTRVTDIAAHIGREMDAGFDWEALRRIRELWPGRLLVKGLVRPDDALKAAVLGCDGVVVSNHGGRQLDGAMASLDALPEVVRAVGSRLTVLVDGGVRRGGDIAKACALGAQGVLVGRATLYGVMAGGEAGARRALEILQDEFVRTLRLLGARSVAELTPDLLST